MFIDLRENKERKKYFDRDQNRNRKKNMKKRYFLRKKGHGLCRNCQGQQKVFQSGLK